MVKILSRSLVLVGVALLAVNIVGFFRYTSIQDGDTHVVDAAPRTVSERQFWDNAYRRKDEGVEAYVRRLNALVSGRMLLIDPRHARPTFFENYILWLYSRYLNHYEWKDTRRAVRLGGGFCSQHAIVLNNILEEQGLRSRIVGLGGHVVNEVFIEGTWKVFDSDFNIAFGQSLKDLEADPRAVSLAYRGAGRPEAEADHLAEVFRTCEDNRHFESSRGYSPKGSLIERLSFSLIWVLPLGLVFLGLAVERFRLTKR